MLNKEAQLNTKMSRGDFLRKTGLASAALVFSVTKSAEASGDSASSEVRSPREIKYTAIGAVAGGMVGIVGVTLSGDMETEYVKEPTYYRVSRRKAIKRIAAGLLSGSFFGGIAGNQVGKNNDNERTLGNVPEQL